MDNINMDQREVDGIVTRKSGLKRALGENEEPVLGLFLRFFPIQHFMAHMNVVRGQWANMATSRHVIPWNKGLFLRFLGVLIQMSLSPMPNTEFHWRRLEGYYKNLAGGR